MYHRQGEGPLIELSGTSALIEDEDFPCRSIYTKFGN